MNDNERRLGFALIVTAGGLIFGFGLAISNMARLEVILDFLQFDDPGLVFVVGRAAVITGTVFALAEIFGDRAPFAGRNYDHRLRSLDRNVAVGEIVFGTDWGIPGIYPDVTYTSLGVGNYPILITIGGMFVGAYLQGLWRTRRTESVTISTSIDWTAVGEFGLIFFLSAVSGAAATKLSPPVGGPPPMDRDSYTLPNSRWWFPPANRRPTSATDA